ncbi:response regulator transcription factor [Maritalea porphyrae]|jgi:two-component system OmpR family response regulator|uniref:winged helix-turn-helix domain-containing protein n=1 Tax=Maritalea porphyrae TaxID=880732 RepID=UPI0022AF282C|nr:response regulator transcription factor [Maritalea porphyrae]MCZ4272095.1 response regulator transcription factor [Maritalea porphyrae]
MSGKIIYILEDDADVRALYARELKAHGFAITSFGTIAEFDKALAQSEPDLCIIDLSLPDGDALTLLRDTLGEMDIPTIVVSGRGALGDRVLGLDFGADDYLVKPINTIELAARARSLLRRVEKMAAAAPSERLEKVVFADWHADFSTLELVSPVGDKEQMSAADARLLKIFVSSPGKVLSRDRLMDLYAEDSDAFDRSIDAQVSRLRKKLQDTAKNPKLIRTVYGAGYVFTPKVEVTS